MSLLLKPKSINGAKDRWQTFTESILTNTLYNAFSQIFKFLANFLTRPFKTSMLLFFSLTCICQNVPDSVKFCHISLAPIMLFGLSNKCILYVYHYQTPCTICFSYIYPQLTYKFC